MMVSCSSHFHNTVYLFAQITHIWFFDVDTASVTAAQGQIQHETRRDRTWPYGFSSAHDNLCYVSRSSALSSSQCYSRRKSRLAFFTSYCISWACCCDFCSYDHKTAHITSCEVSGIVWSSYWSPVSLAVACLSTPLQWSCREESALLSLLSITLPAWMPETLTLEL